VPIFQCSLNPFLQTPQKNVVHDEGGDKFLIGKCRQVEILSVGYSLRETQLLFRKIEDEEKVHRSKKLKSGLKKVER